MSDAPPLAAHCQQIDGMAIEQLELTDRAANELGVRDNRLHQADLVGRGIDLVALALARELQFLQRQVQSSAAGSPCRIRMSPIVLLPAGSYRLVGPRSTAITSISFSPRSSNAFTVKPAAGEVSGTVTSVV